MSRSGLRRQVREIAEVGRDLARGRYPAFVTGGPLPHGHVPVFCFHSLEPESFGRKLAHLARNRYVTLSADEYAQVLSGQRPAPERAVVLTFDDGRSSLRTVGEPLMRRHGMKGIVFVVPGRVASRGSALPPTWDDVDAGRASSETILARENGPEALLSWEELAALGRGGLIDVESHSYSHGQIHTRPRLAGFLSPHERLGYAPLEVPLIHDDGRDLFATDAPLGTPLLASCARLSESLRFYENPEIRSACQETVAAASEEFFRRGDWERELQRRFGRRRIEGRVETAAEREQAIRRELALARTTIAERLGRDAQHLCYPWHVFGPTTRRLATQTGYRFAFCGMIEGVPISPTGSDPMSIARVGEDYVELLPGQGRRSLLGVLALKCRRRLRTFRSARRSA